MDWKCEDERRERGKEGGKKKRREREGEGEREREGEKGGDQLLVGMKRILKKRLFGRRPTQAHLSAS